MIYSTPSLLAVATGIVGSAWTSGAIANFSLGAAPATKVIPQSQTRAQAWAEMYRLGSSLMPKVAATVALAHGYAAYATRDGGGSWAGFAAAGVLAIAIAPFTFIVMAPTNDKLHAVAGAGAKLEDAEVSRLVDRWVGLNSVRALFPLASAATAMATFLNNAL